MNGRSFAKFALVVGVISLGQRAGAVTPGDIAGTVPYLTVSGTQSIRVLPGADVSWLDAHNQSSVEVLGGNISFLDLYDSATSVVKGGDISWLHVHDSGRVDIHSVDDLSWLLLSAQGQGKAHVYGRNLTYSGGHLSGVWANGLSFSFWALHYDAALASARCGSDAEIPRQAR